MRALLLRLAATVGVAAWLSVGTAAKEHPGIAALALMCSFFLAGLILGLRPSWIRRAAAIAIGLAPTVFSAVKVFAEVSRDSTSNNLWPIGLFFMLLMSGFPTGAGWFAADSYRKLTAAYVVRD
jgi:hypothetical protein